MRRVTVARWNELEDRNPAHALVEGVDLVVVRYGDRVSVLYGRCMHRGALMADGRVAGDDLICGVHDWDYRLDSGVSAYNNAEALQKFAAWVEDGEVSVDADEIAAWAEAHPQPYQRDQYQGAPATSTSSRPAASRASVTTARWRRWACPLPTCRAGTTCSSSSGSSPRCSPARFPDWTSLGQFKEFADEVRAATGGIPIGYKMSAQHIEEDIDAALTIGVDYIILDGRGGGTGAAPVLFRDNISVPTILAVARARRHLDAVGAEGVTLVATGGLRTPADFAKALALGADAVALSNAAIQAIGCLGMRACHTNNCPVGIATQKEHLRKRLVVEQAAERLKNFFVASTELMKVLARACGHTHLSQFETRDLTTWKREMAWLTGVRYAGVGAVGPVRAH